LVVSVVIPTYNRIQLLRDTLNSLTSQTFPLGRFEVIVVDDGSEDGTGEIQNEPWPFTLRYVRQSNQGDAAARNLGANQSRADLLVFLDDDIVVGPDYLTSMAEEHEGPQKRIVIGTEHLWLDASSAPARLVANTQGDHRPSVEVLFTEVCSNNMSVRREAYRSLGMMRSLDYPGSSMWCDVDFAFRAYQQGFAFLRSTSALCWHRDYTAVSLNARKTRMSEAARRSVALFETQPDLLPYLPMFSDKTPIRWGKDSPRLIGRKLVRRLASTSLSLWSMEKIARLLKRHAPTTTLIDPLERWIIGGYISRGYRQGLREAAMGIEPDWTGFTHSADKAG
jgi:glycosyltransferase involved in cell wall biosynthesis